MKQICSTCGVMYGLKEPLNDTSCTHGLCPECLREQEVELIVHDVLTNLKIVTSHEKNRLKISLFLNEKEISSDFIDYDEVVRVVEQENEETRQ